MPPRHWHLSMFKTLASSLSPTPRRPFPPLASTRPFAMNRPRNGPPHAQSVPTARDVVPGARVLIVLKADQGSGRQTPGVVRDVLTRGNHPRGIKVRLQDGRVGRVQRLDAAQQGGNHEPIRGQRYTHTEDARVRPEGPPERSLADFMVGLGPDAGEQRGGIALGPSPSVVCPMCGAFEGDEAAVTHHIEREHLS